MATKKGKKITKKLRKEIQFIDQSHGHKKSVVTDNITKKADLAAPVSPTKTTVKTLLEKSRIIFLKIVHIKINLLKIVWKYSVKIFKFVFTVISKAFLFLFKLPLSLFNKKSTPSVKRKSAHDQRKSASNQRRSLLSKKDYDLL